MVFSENQAITQELFNNTLIRKHAHVASIQRLGRQTSDLGFFGYNFFQSNIGGDLTRLNLVWHFGDTLDTLESLFTDLSSFQGHTMVSTKQNDMTQNVYVWQIMQVVGTLPWAQYVRGALVPDEEEGNATHRYV